MFAMAMHERYESKKNYDLLNQSCIQLEKTLERYKERTVKLQRIENIRQKRKKGENVVRLRDLENKVLSLLFCFV